MKTYSLKIIRKLLQKIQEEIKRDRSSIIDYYTKQDKALTDFERGFMYGRMAQSKYINIMINNYIESMEYKLKDFKDRDTSIEIVSHNTRFDAIQDLATMSNMHIVNYCKQHIKYVRVNNKHFPCTLSNNDDECSIEICFTINFPHLSEWVFSSFDICDENANTLMEHIFIRYPEFKKATDSISVTYKLYY